MEVPVFYGTSKSAPAICLPPVCQGVGNRKTEKKWGVLAEEKPDRARTSGDESPFAATWLPMCFSLKSKHSLTPLHAEREQRAQVPFCGLRGLCGGRGGHWRALHYRRHSSPTGPIHVLRNVPTGRRSQQRNENENEDEVGPPGLCACVCWGMLFPLRARVPRRWWR